MNYKVQGRNDISDLERCFFENRGVEDGKRYMALDDTCLIPYSNLDNIEQAAEIFEEAVETDKKITILVDCDADGYTSAAMIYRYIKHCNANADITYLLHTGKQHGLTEDITVPPDTELLIIPDAGTNDAEQCKVLSDNGMKILVFDHHEKDCENSYAVVVNNQSSENYSNKELCGAGVVYKFLQCVDEHRWDDYAEQMLDLVALANISDVMDIRSYETKRLVDKGLSRLNSKCIKAFKQMQEASIGRKFNMTAVAFYISPLINAACRVGTETDKDILFRAFIETDEEFDYTKRGEAEVIKESVYDRAARLCKNAKTRQDNAVKKFLPDIMSDIENRETDKDDVMFVKAPEEVSGEFTGLIAMKLASAYHKPCIMLRKISDEYYSGSARNCDYSPITDLRELFTSAEEFDWCRGHKGAFGARIHKSRIPMARAKITEICGRFYDLTPRVDFEVDFSDIDTAIFKRLDDLSDYFGTGLKEPRFLIKNIPLRKLEGSLIGKTQSTWKFITEDNISIIRFQNGYRDAIKYYLENENDSNTRYINAMCQLGFNDFNGILAPQVQIKEYEVI